MNAKTKQTPKTNRKGGGKGQVLYDKARALQRRVRSTASSADGRSSTQSAREHSTPSKGGGRTRKLAGLGPQPRKRVGAPRSRARTRALDVAITRNGKRIGRAKRASSLAQYNALTSTDAPLSSGTQFHGAAFTEYEHHNGAERHCLVHGRELIGTVSARPGDNNSEETFFEGDRLPGCVWFINPHILAGRLGHFAQLYEQHKTRRLKLVYAPSVPATSPGSVAIYFRNDPGSTLIDTGHEELAHAATFPDFVQTSIWEEATLDVKPANSITQFWDDQTGDVRFEVQGVVQVLAASKLTLDPSGNDGPSTIGNVYLEYEVDFFSPGLDYEVDVRPTTTITLSPPTGSGTRPADEPVVLVNEPSTGQLIEFEVSDLPDGVTDYVDLAGWYFVGTISVGDSTNPSFTFGRFHTVEDLTPRHFEAGVGMVIDFSIQDNAGSPRIIGWMHASLASAEDHLTNENAANESGPDTFVWSEFAFSTSASPVVIYGYWVKS